MRDPLATVLSLRALLLLLAFFFSAGVLASPSPGHEGASIKIISRQTLAPSANIGDVLSTAQACQQYSRVANLSAIGSNSTIRSAFMEASPVGTMFTSAMLNVMQADAKLLSMDVQLNQACGNLTTIALQEVGVNFTMGIVGQFTFTGNPVSVLNGPIIVGLSVACLFIILGPASAL